MKYTYKIIEDVVTGLEVNEYVNLQYNFHCTILGLKNINEMKKNFKNKNNEYLNSLRRMKNWVLQNHPELLI